MKMDFRYNNKLDKKNQFNMFFWVVSKEIYSKGKKVKKLDCLSYDDLLSVCMRFYKGANLDLPAETLKYLEEKLKRSQVLYKQYIDMIAEFGLLEVKLW